MFRSIKVYKTIVSVIREDRLKGIVISASENTVKPGPFHDIITEFDGNKYPPWQVVSDPLQERYITNAIIFISHLWPTLLTAQEVVT
jgi:hypothetical protein